MLVEGMKTVPKNTWLQVVPQLIARIDSPKDLVRNLIHSLLVDVGKQHPQVGGDREGRGGEKGKEEGTVSYCWQCLMVYSLSLPPLSLLRGAGTDLPTDCGSQVGWSCPHGGCQPDPQQPVGPLQPAGAAGTDGV